MSMQLEASLQDRSTWQTSGWCPVEKAMGILGSRGAMLILREAFYGTTRYDEFVARIGMAPATAAGHLATLVEAGLLERHPYQEPGARTRDEYRLTDSGTELAPVVVGLFRWGQRHTDVASPIQLRHAGCGAEVEAQVRCIAGHDLTLEDIRAERT